MKRDEKQPPKAALPITLRAQLAADCSELPRELKHFVHVLALHANYRTGKGLTGQATLARYMSLSRRQVQRLWTRLDTLWEANGSPVGALREARYHTSDAYQIEVAPCAATQLQPERSNSSDARVNATSPNVATTSTTVEATSTAARCDTQSRETPPQSDMGVSITAKDSLRSELLSCEKNSAPQAGLKAEGREGAAPRSAEVGAPTRITTAMLEARWGAELQRRSDEDGMGHARRVGGLRKILAAELHAAGRER